MKNSVVSILLLAIVLDWSCSKDPFPGRVEITSVEDITHNSLIVKAHISGSEGGVGLQVNGVCFDKTKLPVAEGTHFEGTILPATIGEYITGISGLEASTRYIIRAYYETNVGIVYSDTMVIQTKPVEYITDTRDGHVYEVKDYGNHTWMLRNLNYATPGSLIFENMEINQTLFGRLYPYREAVSVCPPGWRLPTDEEWKTLEKYIGVAQEELDKTAQRGSPFGGMMKEPGMRLWESSNAFKSNNHSGFSIVPSGWFNPVSGQFALPQLCAGFWTESANSTTSFARLFYSHTDDISRFEVNVDKYILSVRCVK